MTGLHAIAATDPDFAVLEQDPYSVPPEQLQQIPIWGTVFAGELYPVDEP